MSQQQPAATLAPTLAPVSSSAVAASIPHVLQVYNPKTRQFETKHTYLSQPKAEAAAQQLRQMYWLLEETSSGTTYTPGDSTEENRHRQLGKRTQPVEVRVMEESSVATLQPPVPQLTPLSSPALSRPSEEPVVNQTQYAGIAGDYVGVGSDDAGKPCRVQLHLDSGGKYELDCAGHKLNGQILGSKLTHNDGTVFGPFSSADQLLNVETDKGKITFIRQ